MLKITVHETRDALRLELEGRVAGPWVGEIEAAWRSAIEACGGRKVEIDLTGVDAVDAAGRYLLALIRNEGARFIAPGCCMSALVREIAGEWPARLTTGRRSETE
jgi:ABC-type transporter Mla MlaB component